jgi:hypothetical protein
MKFQENCFSASLDIACISLSIAGLLLGGGKGIEWKGGTKELCIGIWLGVSRPIL